MIEKPEQYDGHREKYAKLLSEEFLEFHGTHQEKNVKEKTRKRPDDPYGKNSGPGSKNQQAHSGQHTAESQPQLHIAEYLFFT